MDDEDPEDLMNLFETVSSNIDTQVTVKIKSDYEPIHLPLSIIEILETWRKSSLSELCGARIGISPCDFVSLDGMFIHKWSESHVEQPSRLTWIINHLHDYFWVDHQSRWKCLSGRMATNEEILLVHSERFLSEFLAVERGEIVDDIPSMRTLSYANGTYNFKSVGPTIARACRIAAGTAIHLVSSVVRREIDSGFAIIRPAGHHSSTDQVGTFCGLNSISMAAVYAIQVLQLDRVLILDWDVHRSGGTEQILGQMSNEDQKKYFLIDIYCAFGKTSATTPVPSNCHLIDLFDKNQLAGDDQYLKTFDFTVVPDILRFQPSLILISAGFDSAKGEAEECAQLTPNGYFQMTKKLKELKIPLLFILEGGYRQEPLVKSIAATFQGLLD
jgi:acetoin utilization deacetylase AcuC-like enzyme